MTRERKDHPADRPAKRGPGGVHPHDAPREQQSPFEWAGNLYERLTGRTLPLLLPATCGTTQNTSDEGGRELSRSKTIAAALPDISSADPSDHSQERLWQDEGATLAEFDSAALTQSQAGDELVVPPKQPEPELDPPKLHELGESGEWEDAGPTITGPELSQAGEEPESETQTFAGTEFSTGTPTPTENEIVLPSKQRPDPPKLHDLGESGKWEDAGPTIDEPDLSQPTEEPDSETQTLAGTEFSTGAPTPAEDEIVLPPKQRPDPPKLHDLGESGEWEDAGPTMAGVEFSAPASTPEHESDAALEEPQFEDDSGTVAELGSDEGAPVDSRDELVVPPKPPEPGPEPPKLHDIGESGEWEDAGHTMAGVEFAAENTPEDEDSAASEEPAFEDDSGTVAELESAEGAPVDSREELLVPPKPPEPEPEPPKLHDIGESGEWEDAGHTMAGVEFSAPEGTPASEVNAPEISEAEIVISSEDEGEVAPEEPPFEDDSGTVAELESAEGAPVDSREELLVPPKPPEPEPEPPKLHDIGESGEWEDAGPTMAGVEFSAPASTPEDESEVAPEEPPFEDDSGTVAELENAEGAPVDSREELLVPPKPLEPEPEPPKLHDIGESGEWEDAGHTMAGVEFSAPEGTPASEVNAPEISEAEIVISSEDEGEVAPEEPPFEDDSGTVAELESAEGAPVDSREELLVPPKPPEPEPEPPKLHDIGESGEWEDAGHTMAGVEFSAADSAARDEREGEVDAEEEAIVASAEPPDEPPVPPEVRGLGGGDDGDDGDGDDEDSADGESAGDQSDATESEVGLGALLDSGDERKGKGAADDGTLAELDPASFAGESASGPLLIPPRRYEPYNLEKMEPAPRLHEVGEDDSWPADAGTVDELESTASGSMSEQGAEQPAEAPREELQPVAEAPSLPDADSPEPQPSPPLPALDATLPELDPFALHTQREEGRDTPHDGTTPDIVIPLPQKPQHEEETSPPDTQSLPPQDASAATSERKQEPRPQAADKQCPDPDIRRLRDEASSFPSDAADSDREASATHTDVWRGPPQQPVDDAAMADVDLPDAPTAADPAATGEESDLTRTDDTPDKCSDPDPKGGVVSDKSGLGVSVAHTGTPSSPAAVGGADETVGHEFGEFDGDADTDTDDLADKAVGKPGSPTLRGAASSIDLHDAVTGDDDATFTRDEDQPAAIDPSTDTHPTHDGGVGPFELGGLDLPFTPEALHDPFAHEAPEPEPEKKPREAPQLSRPRFTSAARPPLKVRLKAWARLTLAILKRDLLEGDLKLRERIVGLPGSVRRGLSRTGIGLRDILRSFLPFREGDVALREIVDHYTGPGSLLRTHIKPREILAWIRERIPTADEIEAARQRGLRKLREILRLHSDLKLDKNARWWRKTLVEIGSLFAIVVPVEIALNDGVVGSFGFHPHPYWIIVLPMAGARGVVAGLLSAAIASVLYAIGAMQALRGADGELWTIGNMLEPILFFGVGFFAGELHDELASRYRKLENRLEDVLERIQRMRQERDVLSDANKELEKRIVDDSVQFGNLIVAATRIEAADRKGVFEIALELVEEHCGAAASVLIRLEDGTLDFLCHRGWSGEEMSQRLTAARESEFVQRATAEGVVVNGFDGEETTPEVGPLVVAPLFDASGVVKALLCLDEIPTTRLNLSTINVFLGIADWISAVLARIAQGEPVSVSTGVEAAVDAHAAKALGSADELGERLRLEMERCARYGVATSLLTIHAVEWTDTSQEGIDNLDRFMAAHFSTGLRPTESLYSFGYPGCYLLVMAGTPLDGAETVRSRLLRRLDYTPTGSVGEIEVRATGPDAEAPDLLSLTERVSDELRRASPLPLDGRCPVRIPAHAVPGNVEDFVHRTRLESSLAIRNGFDLHVVGIEADERSQIEPGLLARHVYQIGTEFLRPTDGVFSISRHKVAVILPCACSEDSAKIAHRIVTTLRKRDPQAPYGDLRTRVMGLGTSHPDAGAFVKSMVGAGYEENHG